MVAEQATLCPHCWGFADEVPRRNRDDRDRPAVAESDVSEIPPPDIRIDQARASAAHELGSLLLRSFLA